MALTLVATAGASNANSYATVAEGNTYHEAHLYASTWNPAIDAKKAQALVWATRLLDEHIDWDGEKATTTQALRWPRTGMEDLDGIDVDDDVIPQKVKDATAELARLLIAADLTTEASESSIAKLKVGAIEIEYGSPEMAVSETIPDAVFFMLRQWGVVRKRGSGAIPLYRV